MQKLLLIEDDVEYCQLLQEYLEPEGFAISAIHNGKQAIECENIEEFDLIVLDVMLPGLGGFEVLRHIRQQHFIPVLMLTARGEEVDRVVGLEMGADDYLPKPCSPRELVARIKAILRRSSLEANSMKYTSEIISAGDIEINLSARTAKYNHQLLDLTNAEYCILEYLLKSPGKVIEKNKLTEYALSRPMSDFDRSIDVHVSNLRIKLNQVSGDKRMIKTARGIGYYLSLNNDN